MDENHSSGPRIGIQVFTNPLEMESFFSEQFDEILKQFGFGQFSGIISLTFMYLILQFINFTKKKIFFVKFKINQKFREIARNNTIYRTWVLRQSSSSWNDAFSSFGR